MEKRLRKCMQISNDSRKGNITINEEKRSDADRNRNGKKKPW